MQPQQLERLRRMINASSMLDSKEKEEWLDLLIVMNDKQVSELETILNTPEEVKVASVAPAPISAPTPVTTPPLSHISNLPSSMALRPSQPPRFPLPTPPRPVRPTLKQWQNNLRHTVEEKELSKPHEEKLLLSSNRPVSSPPVSRPPVTYPKPSTPQRPVAQLPQTPAKTAAPAKTEAPLNLSQAKDVAQLTIGNMRSLGANLVPTLKKMVASSNYFEVLFYLEKSPLYQAYLDTGREALSSAGSSFPASAGGKNLLTKAEFEAFSDLLKSIQIS